MSMIARWQPMGAIQNEVTRLRRDLGEFVREWEDTPWANPQGIASYPTINLWESDDFVFAEVELPGIKLEDLEISLTGGDLLSIKGARKPSEPEHADWHRQERFCGIFERSISLPCTMDPNKVDARLENGVLTIQMAKSPLAKPRRIPVKGY